jgi:DNA-binding transcriptional MerR regulator
MFSISAMSRRTKVKIPTIRYYEQMGLLASERTQGNQRRYGKDELERLSFIRHARDLGFSIEAITGLIALQDHPDRSCDAAKDIAASQLKAVQAKIAHLAALEQELSRIVQGCDGDCLADDCAILASLADHTRCGAEH